MEAAGAAPLTVPQVYPMGSRTPQGHTMTTLLDQLSAEEGREHTAYPDPLTGGAPWTIGVGHTGPEVHRGLTWTDAQIDEALEIDIARAAQGVFARLPWAMELTEERQAVLIGMAFQMGIAGLLTFKNTLAKVQRGDYAGAASGMRNSKWYTQTPRRAERMAKQMETSFWHLPPGF